MPTMDAAADSDEDIQKIAQELEDDWDRKRRRVNRRLAGVELQQAQPAELRRLLAIEQQQQQLAEL